MFRATALQAFEQCPRRFFVEQSSGGSSGNKFTRRGTAVHRVMEAVARQELHPDVEWNTADDWLKEAELPVQERENTRRCALALRRRLSDGSSEGVMSIEERFVLEMLPNSIPLSGQPDLVLFDKERQVVIIVDFKTNRQLEDVEIWSTRLQPRIYAWAVRQLTGGEWPIEFEIVYVNLNTSVRWATDPADYELAEHYRDLIGEFSVYKRTGEWPERLNEWCSNCPLVNSCGAAQRSLESLAALAEQMETREVSLLERAQFLGNVEKLAGNLLDGLREEIKNRMMEDGVETWQEGTAKASLSRPTRRSIGFWDVWDAIRQQPLALSNEQVDAIAGLFGVRLGALDDYVGQHPEVGMPIASKMVVTEAETPQLTIRRCGRK